MKYLSKKGFVHRDLASRNIPLDKKVQWKVRLRVINSRSTVIYCPVRLSGFKMERLRMRLYYLLYTVIMTCCCLLYRCWLLTTCGGYYMVGFSDWTYLINDGSIRLDVWPFKHCFHTFYFCRRPSSPKLLAATYVQSLQNNLLPQCHQHLQTQTTT